MKLIVAAVMFLFIPLLTYGRLFLIWSYDQMLDKADLVVIGKPFSTEDTAEAGKVLDGTSWDVVGLSTECVVHSVLKGDKSLRKIVLHHYRQRDPAEILKDGPSFLAFNGRTRSCYLMYLKKEADGRYAPVTGQIDPAGECILELKGDPR